jgi:hemerythrin-like domain-containing protein
LLRRVKDKYRSFIVLIRFTFVATAFNGHHLVTMENKPIKRSQYILELSKDHHAGLLFCWKIKEGLKRDVDLHRIKKYLNYFWEHHLKPHFGEEEALLFNQADDSLSQQGKNEHLMLQKRIAGLNHNEKGIKDDYFEFAELLIKHIRFEERILFPHLEQTLPLPALKSVQEHLAQQHPAPLKDDYPDEFWIDKK